MRTVQARVGDELHLARRRRGAPVNERHVDGGEDPADEVVLAGGVVLAVHMVCGKILLQILVLLKQVPVVA